MFFTSYHSFSRHHRKKLFTGLATACAVVALSFTLSPNESMSSQTPADAADSMIVSEQVNISETTSKSVEEPLTFAYAEPTAAVAEKEQAKKDKKSESAIETILKNIPFTKPPHPTPSPIKAPTQKPLH